MAGDKEFNCRKCSQEDNDRMVQCDKCDMWYHYECVAVSSGIADESWTCGQCCIAPTGDKQSEQLTNVLNVPQASSSPATTTNKSTERVINGSNFPIFTTANNYASASTSSAARTPSFFGINNPPHQMQNQQNFNLSSQCELQLKMLEEQQRIQQEFIERKYQILSQLGQGQQSAQIPFTNTSNWNFSTGPTPSQLAARQAIPKDLPNFHGDPEEWPLFISSFETSTSVAGYSQAENLMRLQSCLKGKAKELVRSKLMMPTMVPEIIQTLRMCFGRPEHILERVIDKARKLPPPREKLESVIEFALCVKNICSTMEACKMNAHLNNPMLVKELVDKLSNQYKLNWAMHTKDDNIPIVKLFSDWIFQIADAASTVVSTPVTSRNANVNTHLEDVSPPEKKCYACHSSEHKIASCSEFKMLSLDMKWDIVKTNKLCRQCLNKHRRKCFHNNECGIDGCNAKHHQLLHRYATEQHSSSNQNNVNSHSEGQQNSRSFFRIVPIRLHKKNGYMDTFAFLDEGSSVTLIEESVFDLLDLKGVEEALCLKWTGDTTRQENTSVKASLTVSNTQNGSSFLLKDVHTVRSLNLPTQSLNMEEVTKAYPYLSGIPIQSYKNVRPTILIGVNNWKIAVPQKIKEGLWDQPIATKTRLGWTIQGCNGSSQQNAWLNIHSCECEREHNELHQMIKNYFTLDETTVKLLISAEDAKAMEILKTTCLKIDGRYEVGLLWKDNVSQFPESYTNAYKRLMCLKRKFLQDNNLKNELQRQINNLLSKGYARKLDLEEIENTCHRIWYLPIFLTKNLNKPGKVRMVWDAAAKSNGVCLNDFVLSGPDLLKSLVDILLSFRVGKVAVCGDIAEMFHQINVRKEDMNSQRFLWWEKDKYDEQPSVFVMRALTFGISCAPCIAHYVRDYNAEQFKFQYPRAVEAIQHYHYVDDFIDCADDESQAIELATQVKIIHAAAGFRIRNWCSNSAVVLKHLQEGHCEEQVPKDLAATEKILGMYWDPNIDCFVYIFRFAKLRRNVFENTIIPTKRELLQVLMSIFDPLGFLSCYTTTLKIILQEVWRSGIDWDTELCESLYTKWLKWRTAIEHISTVKISRCYSSYLNEGSVIELHTFVDAGEDAFAAVCYLRVEYQGSYTVTIVAGKSKVAPLKPMSIPRLELQAAVMGVRLANKIANIRRLNIKTQFFWSDSKTVLQWLRMDPKKFQQFVMHRIGEILETTNVTQWRWVPSKLNPADLSTKVQVRWDVSAWFLGPTFLQEEKSEWPSCSNFGDLNSDEMKHHTLVISTAEKITTLNLEYFSDWKRLYRAVATFLLYIRKLKALRKNTLPPSVITYEIIQQAKNFIFRIAQENEFPQEISCLKKGKPIEKDSKLICFDVFLDDEGILRARGRASYLNYKDVIILPTKHHVTVLLVRYVHEFFHHLSHETVINNIKSQFYIPKLRVVYKTVRRLCQHCKNASVKPILPRMSTLPRARLASFERPFSYVGIDYFGPLYVTVGRRKEKRWGVLFTCLTVRAVHLEIAHSLDTSSCVMCIKNFIARRGTPHEIYTDNGTNFKAAAKIIGTNENMPNHNEISQIINSANWKFIPPASPHMGGAWERLVRSVKTVLYKICPNMNFNDETLRNALGEVEFIINSRPLTFVSLESCDDEALTPNHLLLGSSSGYKPINNDNADLRQRWHQIQTFANHFCRRWVKEYTPTLTKRTKWHEKTAPLQIGDIVIIVDENLPRHCWPKGRIIDTIIAKDGQVRQVTVKTQFGVLQRPSVKIAKLDVVNIKM